MPKPKPKAPRRPKPPATAPTASPTLLPDDHVRMLVEFLRVGSPELIRAWVEALLRVPESERAGVVTAVTARIAKEYSTDTVAEDDDDPPMFHVAAPPVARDGHTEQIIRSYSAPRKPKAAPSATRRKRA